MIQENKVWVETKSHPTPLVVVVKEETNRYRKRLRQRDREYGRVKVTVMQEIR